MRSTQATSSARLLCGVFALGLLGVFNLSMGSAQPASAYWTQYKGDARHTGRASIRGPHSEVQEKWSIPVNISAQPAVGPDGTVYVADWDTQTFSALRPEDGNARWVLDLGAWVDAAPAIDAAGTIYVPGGSDGVLRALDTATGALRWTFTVKPTYVYGGPHIKAPPTLGDDGTIYLAGMAGDLYALDTAGNVLWAADLFNFGGGQHWFWVSSPSLGEDSAGNERLYIQSHNARTGEDSLLFALDRATGTVAWTLPTGNSGIYSTPTVGDDGMLYIGAEVNGVPTYHAVDPDSGSVVWSFPSPGYAYLYSVALSPDGSAVYLVGRKEQRGVQLYKVDAWSGQEIWRHTLLDFGYVYRASPVVDRDGVVYVGTGNGGWHDDSVLAIDADGNRLFSYRLEYLIKHPLAIGPGGTIYGGSISGTFYALEAIVPDEVPIPVDVKPGACPNPLNTRGRGLVSVAIVGTVDFDVSRVDPNSITLEGLAPVLQPQLEDVATPFDPEVIKDEPTDCTADGADGILDLVAKFRIPDLVAALGDVQDGEARLLRVEGVLTDGTPFTGEDFVILQVKR